MALWESFDLASLLVGLLVGGVGAFLLRLNALKRLSLDVRRIGLNLGVEGFEEPSRGFQIGGNVGGDVAGHDMNKDQRRYETDRSNRLYNVLQALADEKAIRMVRRESIQASSPDPSFKDRLRSIQRQGGDWTNKWIDACLQNPDIRSQIDSKIAEIAREGWQVKTLTFDNHGDGIYVGFDVARAYESPVLV